MHMGALVSAVSLGRVAISETVRFDTIHYGWNNCSRSLHGSENLLHDSEYIGKTFETLIFNLA